MTQLVVSGQHSLKISPTLQMKYHPNAGDQPVYTNQSVQQAKLAWAGSGI